MKKIISIIILITIIAIGTIVMAENEEMTQLKLEVANADEDYKVYMLLPKKYIQYVIEHDNLDFGYDGANTLIERNIPSIIVNVDKVQKDIFKDDGIEYVQIELEDLSDNVYLFNILDDYPELDMIYRIKSKTKDDLLIIKDLKKENHKCNIKYDYKENTVKTEKESKIKISYNWSWWQTIAIILLIIFVSYLFKRRNS